LYPLPGPWESVYFARPRGAGIVFRGSQYPWPRGASILHQAQGQFPQPPASSPQPPACSHPAASLRLGQKVRRHYARAVKRMDTISIVLRQRWLESPWPRFYNELSFHSKAKLLSFQPPAPCLRSFPAASLQLRQRVRKHYARAVKTMDTISIVFRQRGLESPWPQWLRVT